MLFKAKRKKDNKQIKGYFIKIKNKVYLIKPKEISVYFGAEYIWFKGGSSEFEVLPETVEMLNKEE